MENVIDVKPANVLVSRIGACKLCDFGVSTQLAKSLASTYIGTTAYMAVCISKSTNLNC